MFSYLSIRLFKFSLKNYKWFVRFSSPECKFSDIELGFVVDGSASVQFYGQDNFQKMKDFMKKLTRSFNVSSSNTRVGVIVYSTNSTLAFSLDQYSSINETEEAIDNITYPGGGTFTGQALRDAVTVLFKNDTVRPNVTQILVVITDGISTDDVTLHANSLSSKFVYVVGIGQNYDLSELNKITGNKSERVFSADFDTLQAVGNSVRGKICLGK